MDKKNKIILLNSLVFLFCVIIIILYCLVFPTKNTEIAQLKTYEITFDTDGGSIIPSMSIEEGHAIEAPDAPTREGYIFEGWMLGDNEYDFSGTVNGNIVLKAKWTEITPEMVIYTITFDTAGGSEVSSIQVLENGNAYAPTTTREGYVFVEWQLNGEAFDFNTPITGDITLTAVWREEEKEDPNEGKEWTVTFELNNGTSGGNCRAQTVKNGGTASNVCRPTRDGYTFNGWSPNINSRITRNTTFVAQWRQNSSGGGSSSGGGNSSGGGGSSGGGETPAQSYPVTYRFAEGNNYIDVSSCSGQTVQEGKSISANCSASAPAHYSFDGGWSCPSTMPSGGATCTRKIKLNTFTVSCKKTGDSMTSLTCAPYLLENGSRVSGSYTLTDDIGDTYNGNNSLKISEFNDIPYFKFEIGNISGTASKGSVVD